ncbi:MAG TPA: cupin domain-containing protein [Gaiellaceae bacterium]|nr:cupin domain-containing protein [Gaiellaceae bacterium]
MPEARLVEGEGGWLAPESDGWYVLNAQDAHWLSNEMGWYCNFEGDEQFPEVGFNLNFLPPGKPIAIYHYEPHQEGFLMLGGEAVLIVEGEERPLRRWDYVHCPRDVPHVIVAAGEGAFVLAVGGRLGGGGATYPVDATAAKHGASVEAETTNAGQEYAKFGPLVDSRYPGGLLPE